MLEKFNMIILRLVRYIYVLYAFIWFFILMVLVFPIAVIGSLMNRVKGGNLVLAACRIWASVWLFLIGIRHKNIYQVPHNQHEQFIFVANHISYLDIPIIVKAIQQPIRMLGKVEMTKVPVFGFIYKTAIVTVNRSSTKDRARSLKELSSFIHQGISVFIFPEGTFNMEPRALKSFYDGAFRIAIETQTPVKPVLILDSYRLQHPDSVLSLRPGQSRAVFLEPVPVEGYTVSDVQRLKKEVYAIMEQKLIAYQAEWINMTPA